MCDQGRMSYKNENEGRLTVARIGKQERPVDEVLSACITEIERAEKKVILISPNCSLEQMVTAKALAEKIGAPLFGFSDGYIKSGDKDDYLICEDKSANRAGLSALAIDTSKENFEKALAEATLLLNFDNDLSLTYSEVELVKMLKNTRSIAFTSHETPVATLAHLAIPLASYSEYSGMIINCNNVLQSFAKAVRKNTDPLDLVTVLAQLGSPLQTRADCFNALKPFINSLQDLTIDTVPAAGLKLDTSEDANVAA
jgi:NADH-quinone oxidoreductase subunit G